MTRREIIAQLEAEYAEQRKKDEEELERRTDEAFRADPEIMRLRTENASLAVRAMRRIMADPGCAREAGEEMKRRGLENNRQIRQRLEAAGFPKDYLDMRYACEKCRDTGYVGEVHQRFCDCFEKKLLQRMFSDSGVADRGDRFETFDPGFVPDEQVPDKKYTQRRLTVRVKELVEIYANAYPETPKPNILLMGESGLGKTFLLNALAARLIERGFAPKKVTAYQLFEAMRRQHYRAGEGDESLRPYIDAPILLIDDLGSEPMMKNITVEYLYLLLNERCAAKRHTVIATNLSPEQIRERYFERIYSRMMDQRICDVYRLAGKDLRLQ